MCYCFISLFVHCLHYSLLDQITIKISKQPSNTVSLLTKIIDNDNLVKEYGIIREKCKNNPALYKKEYQRVTAKVEVKLNLLGEKSKKRIQEIELESITKNKNLSIGFTDKQQQDEYEKLKNNSTMLSCLKN